MSQPIENYTPQTVLRGLQKKARTIWLVTLFVAAAWMLLIVLAPVAKIYNFNTLADSIYSFFSYICHQIDSRSYHVHDHSLAVCARCFGFYVGFLTGIAVYPLFRAPENTDSFPRFWLFAAMIPMVIDFSLTFFDIWENTHLSRTITGAILGIACAFFIVPAIIEISFFLREKFQRNNPKI